MGSTKQNTPCLGIEYEVHLPAYFALLLNSNPEIEDFKLRSNVQEFGNLDDLLIDIKTRNGKNFYFAFQLKHKEKSSKNLLPTNFEAKGDFNLEKYCEAFKNLNAENRKKYHFILYTNKNFDSSRTNEVQKFDMRQDDSCLGRKFFDTSGEGKHLYKFGVNEETEDGKNVNKEDFREFFSKFSLYTGQTNIRDLDKSHILDILKYRECYVTYIDFFRRWHRGDFIDKTVDKKTLNIHLIDIFLSSVAINYHISDGQDGNLNFFEAMVQQFDITSIDASKQEFSKQLEKTIQKFPEEFNKNSKEELIQLGKKSKLIDRFTKELSEETKVKLLHYFFQKPLILDFHESSEDVIYEASKLCRIQEIGINLVIVGRGINLSKFSHLKILKNLTGVNGNFLEEIKRRCNLSLQGRNISFEEIFEEEIREFVTPREMFQMLKGSFSIGEGKEKLPKCYIPRTVSAIVFDLESIIKHSSRNIAIIFYYEDKFEELKVLIENFVDNEDYLYEDFLDNIILRKKEKELRQGNTFPEIIILRKEECSRKQFDEILKELRKEENSKREILRQTSRKETYSNDRLDGICDKSEEKDVHLFQVVDGKTCLLLMSTKNTSLKEKYKSTKMSVEENNLHVFFNKSINILCAQPGMGKSTLMKYLRNEYDPKFWTLRVDLKAHNHFLKRNHSIEDVLNYFLELEKGQNLFLSNIKRMFLRRKKIALFLDGLDEVENKCVDRVLNITRQLSDMGFQIWLSSRQNLQQRIEQHFNIFTIDINEVNDTQQKNYIENRLTSLYNQNEIEEIVDIIFSNTDLANNRQILEIPLQLHIITQIFLDDKSHYFNLKKNNLFTLTKIFEIFFEGKYQHYLAKIELKHNHFLGELEEKLENYEILALHSVLDDEHFQKLQVEKIIPTQLKIWDFLGIITEINKENKAVFEHLTFAEYFASKFLVKNFDKVRLLKEEIFTQKYQNLLLIFNIMLAEDSPLHLAVIYKDLSRIESMGQSSLVDKGGRNLLQVAACIATRHPPLETSKKFFSSECLVKDKSVKHFNGEDLKIKEIVNRVLPCEPFKNDKIFEWNSLDYALAAGALYIVEAILEKCGNFSNLYMMLGKYYSDKVVAYYSIRFGYHRLLSEIISKDSCHVTEICSDYLSRKTYRHYLSLEFKSSILHFLFFTSDYTKRTRIVELLTGGDVNKTVCRKKGYTFLHFAIFHDDTKFLNFLLEKGADVNIQDIYGPPPLLQAVRQNNLKISKLLVEKGADVNIKDEDGWSPLFWAIAQHNFEISKFLVEKGADVNIKDKKGKSPLFSAVVVNNLEISKLLIEKGADVNVGQPPLLWAVELNKLEISKFLVEKGAAIDIKDKDGWSPLLLAVRRNNLEISKLLVEKGADVNIKDTNGLSALFWAVDRNNFEISKLLVEKGADVNIKDKDGKSLLLLAVERSNCENFKLQIAVGADVKIRTGDGWSPLAVERNNHEFSKLLIEKGADVSIKDNNEWSPLNLPIEKNNFEISKLLIERGAEVNVETKQSKTPLSPLTKSIKLIFSKEANHNESKKISQVLRLAANKGNFNLVHILIENGAIWDAQIILDAIERGNSQTIDLLLTKGADLSKVNVALHRAVRCNKIDVVKYLIENGADVNLQHDGFTILHEASSSGHLGIVEVLLNNPKTAHLLLVPDQEGNTCLHLAVYFGHVEVVELLLKTEIDLDKIDIHNVKYPLYFAAKDGCLQKEPLIEMTRVVNTLIIAKYNTKKIVGYFKTHPCNYFNDILTS